MKYIFYSRVMVFTYSNDCSADIRCNNHYYTLDTILKPFVSEKSNKIVYSPYANLDLIKAVNNI